MIRRVLTLTAVFLSALLLGTPGSYAQDEKPPAPLAAATADDPDISIEHLKLRLAPLTKTELEAEASAWQTIAKAAVTELSGTKLEGTETSATISTLTDKRARAVERLRVVLDELESKGGDPADMRAYAKSVSGVPLDVADAGATWQAITAWVKSREGGVRWALNALKFLVVMLVFWVIARGVRKLVVRAARRSDTFSELLEQFAIKMSSRAVLLLGLIVALGTIGVNVGALLAVIGGASFIIGFALQDTLGNFAAGVMLLIYRPFDVGDSVEVGGVNGKIDHVSLVSTTIRTFDNKVMLVPNKKVLGETIVNASASEERRVDMVFGIGYNDDQAKAEALLNKIVAEHEKVLGTPEPVVKLHELADSSVNFICRPWVKSDDYWDVFWDVTGRVKQEFDRAGISIPFPQQDVHLHQA